MRKLTITTTVAASFGALLASGAIAAAPAAQAAPSDCFDGTACIFDHSNYRGDGVRYGGTVSVPNVGDRMNDRTTSVWNRTDQPVCFYGDTNYDGFMFALRPGESRGVVTPDQNDEISSLRSCSGGNGNGQPVG